MTDTDLAPLLIDALADALGPVTIESLERLTGGASRETWSFDAVERDGTRHHLILQRERGGGDTVAGPPFEVEDQLLRAAADAGVPVAAVVADSDACQALGDARITGRLEGVEGLGPRIVRSERFARLRGRLTPELGRALAAIHSIPVAAVPGLAAVDPVDTVRTGLDLLGVTSPAFELALRYLADNRPAESDPVVVHGDFRVGNLLVDEDDLRAVLDWELAHLGHPAEDLGWLCVRAWRFGGSQPVGGIGSIDELLAAYRAAGGRPVERADLIWGLVAGTLRWGLICAHQASRHLDGHVRSVELAAIGRRTVENEHDLLDLLGIPAFDDGGARSLPTPLVHGRPTAAELVEAVREHLTERVAPLLDGADAYGLRVAANALGIVQRELDSTPTPEPVIDEPSLAARIRGGHEPDAGDLDRIRAAVTARLRVANPRWDQNL